MYRLKELRKSRDMTQDAAASFLGITRGAYSNIETGKREPDIATIFKLADYFGVSVGYLLGYETQKSDPADLEIDEAALDEQLIRLLCQLSPEEQEKVDAFVQGMIAARPTAASQEPKAP